MMSSNNENIVKWLNKELSDLLQFDIGEEYARNIVKIETENEIREFLGSLLDLEQARNSNFLNELLVKLNKFSQPKDMVVYRKPDLDDDIAFKGSKNSAAAKKQQQQQQQSNNKAATTELVQTKKTSTFSLDPHANSSSNQQNRPKRVACECQATEHKLVGNCLSCGRIVCEKEGSGPCYFCSQLVCTREELEKIKRGSVKGEKLKADLMSRTWTGFDFLTQNNAENKKSLGDDEEKLRKAIEHKNKLIDFDRTSAKRTQVIDDESDYFNTNSKWLNQQQRALLEQKEKELRDKRFGSKLDKRDFTFDFAGRKIHTDNQIDYEKYIAESEKIQATSNRNETTSFKTNQAAAATTGKDFKLDDLKFVVDNLDGKLSGGNNKSSKELKQSNMFPKLRVQDQELQQMKDDGMCLTMHQPWASLLVRGIKLHEGRTWYTSYRGRLWIHAAAKEPSESDIKEVEAFYKAFYQNKPLNFPDSYPTSCLLGFVDLDDCLSSDEYKEKYRNGESESEYVFICSNPCELAIKLPMPGQHKIFKLDRPVHQSARKVAVY